MYINLGNIELHKTSNTVYDDWMILSEVVDSKMSYEKPIMVRSVDELEALFGKEFKSYGYLAELLLMRNTLYLYKPISPNSSITDSYIDYDNFEDYTEKVFISRNDVVVLETLKNNPTKNIIKVFDNNVVKYYRYYPIQEDFRLCKDPSNYNIVGETYTSKDLKRLKTILCRKGLKRKYKIANDSSISIWNKDANSESSYELTDVNYLPQNLNKISESLDNRDTLLITQPKSTIPFSYPVYKDGELIIASDCTKRVKLDRDYNCYIDLEKINKKLQSLVVDIYFPYDSTEGWSGYIVVPKPEKTKREIIDEKTGEVIDVVNELNYDYVLFYYGESDVNEITKDVKGDFRGRLDKDGNRPEPIKIESVKDDFLSVLFDMGYTIEKAEEGHYVVYSDVVIPIRNYYVTFNDVFFSIIPNPETTNKLISNDILNEGTDIGVEFWSKTIGRGSLNNDNDYIKVNIKSLENDKYRFDISRYGYSEVFEGPIKPGIGEERLDYTITKNSKLLNCTFKNIREGIREGEFILMGAIQEEYNQDMYLTSIDRIFNEEIYPDFFLVPDKYKYVKEESRDTNYFKEYELFLNYAKNKQCQFLIDNIRSPFTKRNTYEVYPSESPEEVSESLMKVPVEGEPEVLNEVYFLPSLDMKDLPEEERRKKEYLIYKGIVNGNYSYVGDKIMISTIENNGDFVYNYTDDDNYLLYFYKDMKLSNGNYRPGYYVFLNNILLNEIGEDDKRILYEDFAKCAYEKEDFEVILEKYKSNYLSYNNHMYYYKKYFSGKNPNTTIWMRFALSKIYRELEKNKGKLLETNYIGKTKNVLTNLLNKIETRFNIIRCIVVTKFEVLAQKNSIKVGLETQVEDIIDNDIKVDITINYNNKI